MTDRPNAARELALLLVLSTLWGASYTFIRLGVETIPPLTFIAARTLIAGTILVAILTLARSPPPAGHRDLAQVPDPGLPQQHRPLHADRVGRADHRRRTLQRSSTRQRRYSHFS